MVKKISALLIIIFCIAYTAKSQNTSSNAQKAEVKLPFDFKLPNDQWYLAVDEGPAQYIFKRQPVKDAEGHNIIPAIMVNIEDASSYKQDVTVFWSKKMQPFTDMGVKTTKVLIQNEKGYPLTYKNAVFVSGEYTDQGLDHIIYMIYIIDKNNKGIQIYLDMTKGIAPNYEKEFWSTIKSIKEQNSK